MEKSRVFVPAIRCGQRWLISPPAALIFVTSVAAPPPSGTRQMPLKLVGAK
jgi:hypothetical protein